MPLPRQRFLQLRSTDPETYQGISELMDYVEAISRSLNLDPRPAPQATPNSSPVPLPASFQVTGADGHYQVTVTNHPANSQPVLHEIASSSSLNFDLSGGVSVLGPDPRTSWTVANPASTRFWRLRSCFLGSGFNASQFFTLPNAAGPTAVASGVLRSSSTAARTQHSANYVTVSAEYLPAGQLLANGDTSDGTPTLNWPAASISFNGGSSPQSLPKSTLRGLAANTTYAVAWNTATQQVQYSTDGGQLLADNLVYLATVTTPAASGGAASSAGGGPSALGIAGNSGRYAYT